MGKECCSWLSRRLWGGMKNELPIKMPAWEAKLFPIPLKLQVFFLNFGLSPLEFAIIPLRYVKFILQPHNIVNTKISI